MLHQNFKQIKLLSGFFVLPARISPKENSGVNGKFLPKPLLFHLRHPNSKTNEPKFWQILSSPKNSFAKTSSASVPPPARSIESRVPQKNVLILLEEKIRPAKPEMQGVFSFGVAERSEAVARRSRSVQFMSKPPRTRSVRNQSVFLTK
jgi:hypothetical protein